jgi:hypothetical protein
MRRWGRLTQWIVTEQGEELLVAITDFDEGKALELVRAQPTLLANKGDEEQRVKSLMESKGG